jgi:dipeptidyl aminopeptidase/acylaminoacyl peptidase
LSRGLLGRAWPGVLLFAAGSPALANCFTLVPGGTPADRRDVTARDIIELREVGYPDAALAGASPLAVSPDGTRIAFVLSRADLKSDSYCRALVVLPLGAGRQARVADRGGEFMTLASFVRGLRVETGFPALVAPAWSPDGRSIAYLKREHGVTQATVVAAEPGGLLAQTRSPADVEALWWALDAKSLYFQSRPTRLAAEQRIDAEGRSGWLYDARIAPNYGPRPRIRELDAPLVTSILDIASGSAAVADPGKALGTDGWVTSPDGRRARLEREDASPFAPERLRISEAGGGEARCAWPSCKGRFSGLWWAPDGKEIWFQKREGWNNELAAFYRWNGGLGEPVRTLASLDAIQNCVAAGPRLICTSESSTEPRRIVLVDPATGTRRTLFDANPEFAALRIGRVTRLRFHNGRGLPAWADLVLPPSYHRGERLPLVVVQYNSRGFLRGGTGNEYPVYPLAARGFAVLSLERPPAVASTRSDLRTDIELNAENEKGWSERRSLLSATLRALDLAVATGAVDPRRIGITGLSDGATAARFALLNSGRFKAAAISSCCPEPKTAMTYGGIAWAQFNRAIGCPPATLDDPAFWAPMSMALNAARMRTPLLIQQSDDEYLLSLEAFEALREKEAPVELYVFPDEHHVKWRPCHKLAVFERAADWFDFWLNRREDPGPAKAAQYRRWEQMRSGLADGRTGLQFPSDRTEIAGKPRVQTVALDSETCGTHVPKASLRG